MHSQGATEAPIRPPALTALSDLPLPKTSEGRVLVSGAPVNVGHPDLVLDLPLLPARSRRAGDRIDQVMVAHPQKTAVVLAVLADEDAINRRLHVVVDAARAGPLEEGEGAVVRVEHHLMGLARVGAHEQHPAMTQPDVRHLDGDRRAVDQHDLGRPVELVGLARCKAQRYVGFRRRRPARDTPCLGVATNRVVAAAITKGAQLLEYPDQRQPLAYRLALVRQQQRVDLGPPRADLRQRLPAAHSETRSPLTGSPCARPSATPETRGKSP